MTPDPNRVMGRLVSAQRTASRFTKVRGRTMAAKFGLRFENSLGRALEQLKSVEHNPWFEFRDASGFRCCSPDFLIDDGDCLIVVECKYTYTPLALQKLKALYIPVISLALNKCAHPLVIVRNLTPDSPFPHFNIGDAICHNSPLYQWLPKTPLNW